MAKQAVDAQDKLHHNQDHNVPLHPRAAVSLQEIKNRFHRSRNQTQLAIQDFRALLKLKLILEPQIELLQLRMIPEQLRPIADFDAGDHLVFVEQAAADV